MQPQPPSWIPKKGSNMVFTFVNGQYWMYENGNWRIISHNELKQIAERNTARDNYDRAMEDII